VKVEVKKVDTLRRELKFVIPKERVSKKLEEIYESIGKQAKIKGFRQGKAPRHVVEAQHGELAQEETLKEIIPEVYQEGIQQEEIVPIDLPEIHDVSFKDGVITFTAKLDIKPEVKVKNYKGLKVKRKSSKVTDEELNKTLDYFKKGQGDDKEVKIDDEFARGLGFPSLEELKKSFQRQLEIDKDRQNRIDIENQVVEELIKNSKLTVPQSLVDKHLERRVQEIKNRYKSQGMAEDQVNKKEEDIRKELKGLVDKDIKVYFIFEKIAQLEGITLKENENMPNKVMEFLLKEAKWEE